MSAELTKFCVKCQKPFYATLDDLGVDMMCWECLPIEPIADKPDALQKENEELKRCLAEFNMDALTKRENNERKLRESLKAALECLERLTMVGPPSVPTTGQGWAEQSLKENCEIARQCLADLQKKVGGGE